MACLGDLRDDGSDLFTPSQAREAVDDLVGLLPQMDEGALRQYGLKRSDAVMVDLGKLQATLHASVDETSAEARELAKTCMNGLLGKSF